MVIWNELILTTLYIASYDVFDDAFVCFIGMGEPILVENFVHCGFCSVSGIGSDLGFQGRVIVGSYHGD